jgi:hypothetical protein
MSGSRRDERKQQPRRPRHKDAWYDRRDSKKVERIVFIERFKDRSFDNASDRRYRPTLSGYLVKTTRQEIIVAIGESDCCGFSEAHIRIPFKWSENGQPLPVDREKREKEVQRLHSEAVAKLVGAKVLSVKRTAHLDDKLTRADSIREPVKDEWNETSFDCVNIETDTGRIQLLVACTHNGFYPASTMLKWNGFGEHASL